MSLSMNTDINGLRHCCNSDQDSAKSPISKKPKQQRSKPCRLSTFSNIAICRIMLSKIISLTRRSIFHRVNQRHETLQYSVVKVHIDTNTLPIRVFRPIVDHVMKNYVSTLKIEGEVGDKKVYDPRSLKYFLVGSLFMYPTKDFLNLAMAGWFCSMMHEHCMIFSKGKI
jgi:hypothetical protein